MPATAPNPKKKAAAPKSSAAAKPAKPKPAKKNSNFIPNFLRGKVTLSPDFFDEHERPENWPSGQ